MAAARGDKRQGRGSPSRAAALLDRDGTLIEDVPYLADPAGVRLLPGVAAGLRRLRAAGYALVLVTNQSGIGRGYFTAADLARVNTRLEEILAGEGAALDALYHCPHAPEAGCDCRKPAPGMALRAARDLGLDLSASVVVGDRSADIGLGRRIGATTVLVGTGDIDIRDPDARDAVGADLVAATFDEGIARFLATARAPGQPA